MSTPSPRRYLSIWLRRLSTDRIERRMSPDAAAPPLATVSQAGNAMRLAAVNDRAAALGLKPGRALADARAMHPGLAVAQADEAGDGRLLETAADWCERFTPLVALDLPDGLMLDMTGGAHLFGGEETMRRDVRRRFLGKGLRTRAAIASTPGCAWAIARFGRGGIVPDGGMRASLLDLPLAALRLAPGTIEALRRAGLIRIGDVVDLPRAPLAARFGAAFMERLDQALGRADEALAYRRPPPEFRAERAFAEPLMVEEGVLLVAEALAAELEAAMERHDEGARRIELALFRVDGVVRRIAVGTGRPVRDGRLVRRLLAEKIASLQSLDMGYGFDMIRLTVRATERLPPGQMGLDSKRAAEHDMAELIDRIAARLGERRIVRLVPRDTHVPEGASAARPAQTPAKSSTGTLLIVQDSLQPARPIRLFAHPEPVEAIAAVPDGPPVRFRWRRVTHNVALAEGPERIAMEWWRDAASPGPTRDYFRVETTGGRRFWLYREGIYDVETPHPRWFMHGLFA